mgnify:CR=1 FL=1
MATARELLRQGRTDELWQRYLGFLDLSLEEAMTIQKRKVLEHVAWLAPCELGRKIIGPHVPKTVDEFRERVPLTTYADYAPYLLERKADALPEEPLHWMRTSGRGGEYSAKWSPVFRDAWEDMGYRAAGAIVVMAAARFKGDFRVRARDKLPFTWAPPPFSLGLMGKSLLEELPLVAMPAEDVAASMDFQQRIGTALQMGMREGIDHFFGLASVLVKIGEQFAQNSSRRRHSAGGLPHPKTLWRILKGLARSKLAGRPMYPKDLWDVKGIAAGGTDTSVFAERIYKYWGVKPLEIYGSAEFGTIGLQTWDRQAITPLIYGVFFEFIPAEDSLRSREEPGHASKTLLLDEVQPGEVYEIVLTSFKFTPFTRYRIGDLVRVVARRNEAHGIDLPQFTVEGRWDDVIDLAGFTRLTERTIWYAIEGSGIPYEEWMCRKEMENEDPVLRLWLEPKDHTAQVPEVQGAIHESLKQLDSDYRDLETMLGYHPLRVTLLSPGTFQRYALNRQAAGAEPAHFKPRHFVHSDEVLNMVLQMDAEGRQG